MQGTAGSDQAAPPFAASDPSQRRRGRRKLAFIARRFGLACLTLLLACALTFGLLLLIAPSTGNAPQLARAIDQQHGAPYPGVVVPYKFATALEATEDHRFASEPGIDPFAVARVSYSYLSGQGDQGGATLYQQLAKMLHTPERTGLTAEIEQVALAVKLKYGYSEAEILRLYADVAYFGHGFYGLEDASCGYFGVRPEGMSWPQAALLAGLVQGPSTDDPIDHPAAGLAREQHVIGRLVTIGAISEAEARVYLAVPLASLLSHAGSCRASRS
jgi:membrane peptidoglycan carboxypeptidase